MSITRAAIEGNRITLVALVVVLLGGYIAYQRSSRAEDPGFPIRTAMVQTYFPGASPERVELLVSDKLEKVIQEMPELDDVKSTNRTGVSVIHVNIKETYKRHQLRAIWDSLRRKVQDAVPQLPDGVVGPFVNDEFGDVYGTVVGITGDGFSYKELKDIADDVRDEVLLISDVAKVQIFGAQDERIFIEFRNERLSEVGLSPSNLQRILESQNIVIPGGRIRAGEERYALEPTGNYESVEDIEETLVRLPGRQDVVPLKDIVKIERGYVDPPSKHFHDTGVPGLALAISMREGGNIVGLGDQIQALVRQVQEQYPIGVEFKVLLFQPDDVSKLVNGFTGNLVQAIVVVLIAMLLFLGLRTGLVVASLIPSAMAAALLVMFMMDIGLDQMSLASLIIALGMLVDNAIVMAESTMVQMSSGKKGMQAAVDSANELRVPLLVSSLTTCAAFLPIYLAESTTGEYTAPLFKVVTITLLCSWIAAITMVPLLCATFLKVSAKPEGDTFNSGFYKRYRGALVGVLRRPVIALAGVLVIFVIAMRGFGAVPQIFFPPSDNPTLIMELELPAGTAIEKTRETTERLEAFLERELKATDERPEGLKHWASFIGDGGPRFYLSAQVEPPTPDYAILVAIGTDLTAVHRAVGAVDRFIAENMPDVRATVKPRALGPSSKAPVMFAISGRDADEVFGIVEKVKDKLEDTPGTRNIRDDWGQRTKKVTVNIDQSRARRAGLSSQDIAISLQTALDGFQVTQYREGDLVIPVTLRSIAADRDDIGKIENLSVFSALTGKAVPLKQVADIDLAWQAGKIVRKDRLKTVTVMSNLEPGVTEAEVNKVIGPWLDEQQKTWPLGYRWSIEGTAKNSQRANESINAKLPIAGFIILMLLVLQFNSMRKTAIVLFTIPLSLIGVVIGLLTFKSYFGFMTLLGIIALAGIVINNAIVLIDRIKIEIEDNGHPPARAIVESAQRRLRPILLTTCTTVVGLVPLWMGGGPMYEPMAIGIIFGLLFATVLTLGVVPILYSLLFRVSFKGFEYR